MSGTPKRVAPTQGRTKIRQQGFELAGLIEVRRSVDILAAESHSPFRD